MCLDTEAMKPSRGRDEYSALLHNSRSEAAEGGQVARVFSVQTVELGHTRGMAVRVPMSTVDRHAPQDELVT